MMNYSKTTAVLGSVMLLLPLMAGAATADGVVDGDNGVLHVSGELTRGACNIDADSKQQAVRMGSINSGELTVPGKKARAKAFHLHLSDCISSGTEEGDRQIGSVVRVEDQPEVRISFISKQDNDNPQLIAVDGAKGFGLRLEDSQHHRVQPDEQGEPLVLQAGNDELIYRLIPERTRAPLQEGAWRSTVYMRFSYE